jgi:omega-6 fatty acid desaturase (delta-12 desaturase)
LCLTIGWRTFLLVQGPIIVLASILGVWLFYVQHQFSSVYWRRTGEWNYLEAAMMGASYYKLPKLLQWFSGNIGFHHLHHLAPRIPNYNLEKCYNFNPALQCATTLTLKTSLQCLRLRMFDEDNRRLIGYRELKELLSTTSSGNHKLTSPST